MADQQRWFKFWYSALADDSLSDLTPAHRWAWVVLGAHTKIHGNNGRISISPNNTSLAASMCVTVDDLLSVIKSFPHLHVEEGKNRHDHFTVTWHNWVKYQLDSTQAERAKASRSKRREEQKRIRRDEIPNNNTMSGKPDDAHEILQFLNRKTGRNFQSEINLGLIRARLKAGATVLQCRSVIVVKMKEWKGTEMEKYLRPATLFNATKFAQYLGELPPAAFSPEEESHA